MAEAEKKTEGYGIFYETDDDFRDEVKRFLSTRRGNAGATEWQIHHVVQTRPFVTAMEEARSKGPSRYFLTSEEQMRFHRSLRRHAIFPVIKKLLNEGYSIAEVAEALSLPYSTAYYYAKKIKSHKRLREECRVWQLDDAKTHIVSTRLPYDQQAALARKETIRKAQEKRTRKAAKLKAIYEKKQANHVSTRDRMDNE